MTEFRFHELSLCIKVAPNLLKESSIGELYNVSNTSTGCEIPLPCNITRCLMNASNIGVFDTTHLTKSIPGHVSIQKRPYWHIHALQLFIGKRYIHDPETPKLSSSSAVPSVSHRVTRSWMPSVWLERDLFHWWCLVTGPETNHNRLAWSPSSPSQDVEIGLAFHSALTLPQNNTSLSQNARSLAHLTILGMTIRQDITAVHIPSTCCAWCC